MTTFNVYRRESNDINPPVAIATGLTSMSYSDDTAEVGKTYLYSVGAVKNGLEKISEEKTVFAGIRKYRHIRIYMTSINGGDKLALQEVEVASVLGGTDITFPSMGSNQSSSWQGMVASKLVNRNYTDYVSNIWEASNGSVPQWVHFDFGAEVDVAEVRIWAQNWAAAGVVRCPKTLTIQGAKNDGVWENIFTYTDVTGWALGKATIFNLLDGTFKYQI